MLLTWKWNQRKLWIVLFFFGVYVSVLEGLVIGVAFFSPSEPNKRTGTMVGEQKILPASSSPRWCSPPASAARLAWRALFRVRPVLHLRHVIWLLSSFLMDAELAVRVVVGSQASS